MSKNFKQNAPKNSKSSAQQSEELRTSPSDFFDIKWGFDNERLAHLPVNASKDSRFIQALSKLFQESVDGFIEPYWDASGHKRYRHYKGHFVFGFVVNGKTYRFDGNCSSNLMYIIHVNNAGQEIWRKEIDLYKHVSFLFYTAQIDYMNLAIEIWETIKTENEQK